MQAQEKCQAAGTGAITNNPPYQRLSKVPLSSTRALQTKAKHVDKSTLSFNDTLWTLIHSSRLFQRRSITPSLLSRYIEPHVRENKCSFLGTRILHESRSFHSLNPNATFDQLLVSFLGNEIGLTWVQMLVLNFKRRYRRTIWR